jgi:hypothetical protein
VKGPARPSGHFLKPNPIAADRSLVSNRTTIPLERIYQSKAPMVGAAFGAMMFLFLGVSSILAAPSLMQKVGYGSICLLTSAALYRFGRADLTTTEEGIRVRNPWSHYELRWEQIDRFELGRWRLNPAVCLVHRIDGDTRPAMGIAEGNLGTGSAQKTIKGLNDQLARHVPQSRPVAQVELFGTSA